MQFSHWWNDGRRSRPPKTPKQPSRWWTPARPSAWSKATCNQSTSTRAAVSSRVRGTTSDDERADQLRLAIQQVKEAVDRVYRERGGRSRHGSADQNGQARHGGGAAAVAGLHHPQLEEERRHQRGGRRQRQEGPQIRFEPFGHEVSFDSDGVRRLGRHAVDGSGPGRAQSFGSATRAAGQAEARRPTESTCSGSPRRGTTAR